MTKADALGYLAQWVDESLDIDEAGWYASAEHLADQLRARPDVVRALGIDCNGQHWTER